jgi:hypothetical protein
MLPFHLAMRHGSSDEVVDFLLESFPDAVNVRAKNNRTALECAMRSRKKARARMLCIFLEKTQERTDMQHVKMQLHDKNCELDELQWQLSATETAKSQIEYELAEKINQLLDAKSELEARLAELKHTNDTMEISNDKTIGQLTASKYHDDMETQRKISALEVAKLELEKTEKLIQADEARLQSNLNDIERRVGESIAKKDLEAIRTEVSWFKSNRLEHTLARAQEQIEALKASIKGDEEHSDAKLKAAILHVDKKLRELEKTKVTTADEAQTYKLQIDQLKSDLRNARDNAAHRQELMGMKAGLESQLKMVQGQDPFLEKEFGKFIVALTPENLLRLCNTELMTLRKDVALLKLKSTEKSVITQTKRDLRDIKAILDLEIKQAPNKFQSDLIQKKKAIDNIDLRGFAGRTNKELMDLQTEVSALKEELTQTHAISIKRDEFNRLRKEVEAEIKASSGKQKLSLASMRKELIALEKAHQDPASVNGDKVNDIRKQLKSIQLLKADIKKTEKEMKQVQTMAASLLKASNTKNRSGIVAIMREIDSLIGRPLETKSRIELEAIKSNVRSLRNKMSEDVEEFQTKLELNVLKKKLADAIDSSEDDEQRKQLLDMKQTMDCIDFKNVQAKGVAGWRQLKEEIGGFKLDLLKSELVSLKEKFDIELREARDKSSEQYKATERAFNILDLETIRTGDTLILDEMKKQAEIQKLGSSGTLKRTKEKGLFHFFGKKTQKASLCVMATLDHQPTKESSPTNKELLSIQPYYPPVVKQEEMSQASSQVRISLSAMTPKLFEKRAKPFLLFFSTF